MHLRPRCVCGREAGPRDVRRAWAVRDVSHRRVSAGTRTRGLSQPGGAAENARTDEIHSADGQTTKKLKLRIVDCGLRIGKTNDNGCSIRNPKSAIGAEVISGERSRNR